MINISRWRNAKNTSKRASQKENINLSSKIFAIKLDFYHAKKPCDKFFEGLKYMKTNVVTVRICTKN